MGDGSDEALTCDECKRDIHRMKRRGDSHKCQLSSWARHLSRTSSVKEPWNAEAHAQWTTWCSRRFHTRMNPNTDLCNNAW